MRFGILCESLVFEAWQAKCVRELLRIAQPALLIVDDNRARESTVSRFVVFFRHTRSALRSQSLLWFAYRSVCVRRNVAALKPLSFHQELRSVPRIRCTILRDADGCGRLADEDIRAIAERDLDFIIQFGLGCISGEVMHTAKWGIWRYSHDSILSDGIGPPGFWEIYHRAPCTSAALLRPTDDRGGAVNLQEGTFRTDPSYVRNLNHILMNSAGWVARVCKELKLGQGMHESITVASKLAGVTRPPSEIQMLVFFLRSGLWRMRKAWARFFLIRWELGVTRSPLWEIIEESAPIGVKWLARPQMKGFLADPFLLKDRGDTIVILAEEFVDSDGRGRISEITLDEKLTVLDVRPVISEPYHLSYPFIIQTNGTLYCAPEAASSNGVTLYTFDERGAEWKRSRRIVEGFAVLDPTIVFYHSKWWLFCSDWATGSGDDNLCVFYSNALDGEWTPHPLNPVKRDVRSSRPAGPLFIVGQTLYRPGQDCSLHYGCGITVNQIVTLNERQFREVTIGYIGPGRSGTTGIHTIGSAGSLTVVDGRHLVFAPLRKMKLRWKELSE